MVDRLFRPRVALLAALCLMSRAGTCQEAAAAAEAGAAASVDRYGDPLPKESRLRLGTVRLRLGNSVVGVAFAPDGESLTTVGWDDAVRAWDVDTGRPTQRFALDDRDGATFALAFSPDGTCLVTTGDGGRVRLWDYATGAQLSKEAAHVRGNHGVRTQGAAFSPDGRAFATSGEDHFVRLWDAQTGKQLLELQNGDEGGAANANPVAFSPDGALLAAASARNGEIRIWDLKGDSKVKLISKAHERDINSLAFTADGRTLISSGSHVVVTGGNRGHMVPEIRCWDPRSGEKQPGFETDEELQGNCSLALSRDGQLLVSGHYEKLVLWDVAKRSVSRVISAPGHHWGGHAHQLAISPDKRLVAAGTFGAGSNKAFLFDLDFGEQILKQDECHKESILGIDASPDGTLIVTGSADGSVRLWDAKTGKPLRMLDQGAGWTRFVRFFPDGKRVALGRETHSPNQLRYEGEVKVVNVSDGAVIHRWEVSDRVMCGALSDDGERLAVGIGLGERGGDPFGSRDGALPCLVMMWDLTQEKPKPTTTIAKSQIGQIVFAGRDLLFSEEDQKIGRWNSGGDGGLTTYDLATEGVRGFSAMLMLEGETHAAYRGLNVTDRTVHTGLLGVKRFDNSVAWEKMFDDVWPRAFAASADGKWIAAFLYPLSGSEGSPRIGFFAASDGREVHSFPLDDGTVRSLAFSRDGRFLMTGMEASDALVWETSFLSERTE
jgi:WD40 repeat protein